MNYPCGSNAITRVPKYGRRNRRGDQSKCKKDSTIIIRLEDGERVPEAKKCRQPLEAKMIKETDFPLEHLNTLKTAQWVLF